LRWAHSGDEHDPQLDAAIERTAPWIARERFAEDPRVTELLQPNARTEVDLPAERFIRHATCEVRRRIAPDSRD
jgi:hypothetical protein